MEPLLGKTLAELQDIAIEAGLPRFVGKQICEWLYRKRVTSFDAMSNISLKAREALKQNYCIGRIEPTAEAISVDGTRKYLFPVYLTAQRSNSYSGQYIECVYLPEDDRVTLCVSTQAGCKMGCKFCMTGTLGFHGNLSAADILAQILHFPDLTNLVLMGEGEESRKSKVKSLLCSGSWMKRTATWRSHCTTLSRMSAQPLCRHNGSRLSVTCSISCGSTNGANNGGCRLSTSAGLV